MCVIRFCPARGGTPSWRSVLYSLECPRMFTFGEYSLPDPDMQALAEEGISIEIEAGRPLLGLGESRRAGGGYRKRHSSGERVRVKDGKGCGEPATGSQLSFLNDFAK